MKVKVQTKVVESVKFEDCQNGEVYRRTIQIGTRTTDFYFLKSSIGMIELAPAAGHGIPKECFATAAEYSDWRFFHCSGAEVVI